VYRIAEEEIGKGLSLGARLTLGIASALFGLTMLLVAPPTDKAAYFYMLAGFCFLICIACVTRGRIRQFIGSLIGTALFVLSLSYLGFEAMEGRIFSSSRSEPSLLNAIFFLIAFGIPGAAYAAKARFGLRKAH